MSGNNVNPFANAESEEQRHLNDTNPFANAESEAQRQARLNGLGFENSVARQQRTNLVGVELTTDLNFLVNDLILNGL
jgi:hypothetical protein